jgi:hypothetical protein
VERFSDKACARIDRLGVFERRTAKRFASKTPYGARLMAFVHPESTGALRAGE